MKRKIISAILLIVMLISLVPAQAFAQETTADEPETLPEAQQIPAEETIPDEEVEIIPMPDAEYEEIIEEPAEEPAEEPEPTDEPEEDEEPAEKVSVRFDLTPAELTLRVYPADAAESPETQINIPDETDITAPQDELAEEYTAAEPQPIAPEADGTYLLLPGEYCYDAECEGYIPMYNCAFTVSESTEIDVTLEIIGISTTGIDQNLETAVNTETDSQDDKASTDPLYNIAEADVDTVLTVGAKSRYNLDYRKWSQAKSGIDGVRNSGCWVVAQAKLLVHTGVESTEGGFNPDIYAYWQEKNNLIRIDNAYQLDGYEAPIKYAEQKGNNYLTQVDKPTFNNNDEAAEKIWEYIHAGYYIILGVTGVDEHGNELTHFTYIDRDSSTSKSDIRLWDSISSENDDWCLRVLNGIDPKKEPVYQKWYTAYVYHLHTFGEPEVTEATDGSDGKSIIRCTQCGHKEETILHNFVPSRTADDVDTCKYVLQCTNCPAKQSEVTGEHEWDDWTVIASGGCTNSGGVEISQNEVRKYICKICKLEVYQEVVKGNGYGVLVKDVDLWAAICNKGTGRLDVYGQVPEELVVPLMNEGIGSILGEGMSFADVLHDKDGKASVTDLFFHDLRIVNQGVFKGFKNLKNINLEGVVNIGKNAFEDCQALTSILLPTTLKSVAEYAFKNCTGLKSVHAAATTVIENFAPNAFSGCDNLSVLQIPYGVAAIPKDAYKNNTVLTSVIIPSSVTSIENGAFWGCSSLTNIEIPSSVQSIGDYAFCDCTSLTSISLSDVKNIGNRAFRNCVSLNSIDVANAKSIGEYAFYGCGAARGSITLSDEITRIEPYTFYGCSSIEAVIIPDGVTIIRKGAFNGCSAIKTLKLPISTDYEWKKSSAFYGCSALETLELTRGDGTISHEYYYGYGYNLSIAQEAKTTLKTVIIDEEVKRIPEFYFEGCTAIETVRLPSTLEEIMEGAFSGCSSLANIEVSESVQSIGDSAFYKCASLTSINLSNAYFIGEKAFWECESLAFIDISSVRSIGHAAFLECDSLAAIDISNAVSIGTEAFSGCSALKSVILSDELTHIQSKAFYWCTSIESLVIPDGVTSIGAEAFSHCYGIKTLKLPLSAAYMLDPFPGCSNLETIEFTAGNGTVYAHFEDSNYHNSNISQAAKESLKTVIFDEGIKYIPGGIFENCSILETVKFPSTAKEIGIYAFSGCSSLVNIEVPASMQKIEKYAFYNCSSLTNVYYFGLMEQWEKIGVGSGNECLVNASIHISSDIKVTVDREYITTQIGDRPVTVTASVTPVEWKENLKWYAENPEDGKIISISENGEITPLAVGTAYAVAALSYDFTARCRVDVTEKSVEEEIEISGIELGTMAVTSELYSRNYAEAEILLLLPQNMSVMSADAAEKLEDNGIAIKSARFTDPAAAEMFDLTVVDDRRVAVVPKNSSIENAKAVKGSYTSAVAVTVGNTEFVTDAKLRLTVKKTMPNLKADTVQFNSFYSGQSAPIVINGASVTAVRPDTGKKLAVPAWLTLSDDGKLSIAPDAPKKSASGSAYILVDTEEWAVPAAVTVSVKNIYKAPKLKLSAASVTMSSVSSRGVEMKLMPTAKNETLEQYNVTGLTAYDGYTVENFDAETGAFTLKTAEGSKAGRITLYASFADTETAVPIALTVRKTAPVIKLKTASVTLNPAYGDTAIIDAAITPADYGAEPTVSVSNADALDARYNDGRLYVHSLPGTKYSSTYKVTVSIPGGKEAVLTVRTAKENLKPGVTLRAAGAIDLTYPDSAVTLTPTFKNFNGGFTVTGGRVTETKGRTAISEGDLDTYFTVTQTGNTIRLEKAENAYLTAGNTYTVQLTLSIAGMELTASAKITVKATAVNLRLSKSALTLNKLVNDASSVAVTCTTKNYVLGEPVISVMDKTGKNSAEGKIDTSYSGGKLYVAVNGATEYGASYKVLISAGEGYKAAALTVTIPAQAKSAITGTLKVKGSIDIIRSGSGITLTPTYKNVSSAGYTERVEVYSSADKFARPVEGVFAVDGMKLTNICADSRVKYKVRVIASFASGAEAATPLTAITVKTGAARLTVSGKPALYLKDVNSRGDFRITSADLTLNGIAKAEIKDAKNAAMFELYEYGGGRFAIGFKDGVIATSAAKLRGVSIPINIWLDGNETAKPNTTVTVRINIAK